MTPVSDSYLGVPGYVLFWVLFAIALGLFAQRFLLLIRLLKLGQSEDRFHQLRRRLGGMLVIPLSQVSNLRHVSLRDLAPVAHALMFWGLGVFVFGYIVFFGLGAGFGVFPLLTGGMFERVLLSVMETMGILIILGTVGAVIKRYLVKPARLERHETTSEKVIQPALLAAVVIVAVLLYLLEGFGYAAGGVHYTWPVIGMASAGTLQDAGISSETLTTVFSSLFWFNYLLLLATMVYTPRSKHLHPLFIFPNVAFRNLAPKGTLRSVDLNDTGAITRADIRDFTWKQLLDSYACTWCGRCHIACPAQVSGKPLSPRELILGTKDQLLKEGPGLLKTGTGDGQTPTEASGVDMPSAVASDSTVGADSTAGAENAGAGDTESSQQPAPPPFIGSVISEEGVWACTTCRACMEVCPSYNEQMSTIIDLRRHLQMVTTTETGRETLKNLRVRAHPWRGTTFARTDWTEGLDIRILGDDADVEVLYWVGCTQALEDRTMRVAQAIALLLQRAGVDFGILGEEEMCCGDPARRLGAEHIFQMLATNNIQLLDSYGVKKIVTACPHCYNTLKNEYPELGGHFEILHHTEMLADLVGIGQLTLGDGGTDTLTYQDPCYLGRYNDIYEPGRQVLRSIPGKTLVEMERNRLDGFCCGGGGGRMWLEESTGTRINALRLDQVEATGAKTVATACPYCMQMLEDAARSAEIDGSPTVKDVAEILAEAVLADQGPRSYSGLGSERS